MDCKDFDYKIIDEVFHEIDLTLDEDYPHDAIYLKQEKDNQNSEAGEAGSAKGEQEEECNRDSLRQPPSEDGTEVSTTGAPQESQERVEGEDVVYDTSDDFKESKDESENVTANSHPYQYIIDTFEFQKDQLSVTSTEHLKSHEEVICQVIKNVGGIVKMLNLLRKVKAIGVDVKLCQLDNYTEIISTMQISTVDVNFILDAEKFKNELLMLTEIFINPKIVKILWRPAAVLAPLQNKLHLYMVNIFDIQEAKILANETTRSWFAILREDFNVRVNGNPDVDYRERPIPENLKDFLKTGVHYLHHLYHMYKNKLINQNFNQYKQFLEKCRDLSKQTFQASDTLQTLEQEVQKRQKAELEVLKKLYLWRQETSARVNLSANTVLPKPALMRLVHDLPISDKDILSRAKSSCVKRDVATIKKIIMEVSTGLFLISKRIQPVQIPVQRVKRPAPQQKAKRPPPQQKAKRPTPQQKAKRPASQQSKDPKAYYQFVNKLVKSNGPPEKRPRESGAQKRKRFRDSHIDIDERQSSPKKQNVSPWAKKTYFPENFEGHSSRDDWNDGRNSSWDEDLNSRQSDGFRRPNAPDYDTKRHRFNQDNSDNFQQHQYQNRNYDDSSYRRRFN